MMRTAWLLVLAGPALGQTTPMAFDFGPGNVQKGYTRRLIRHSPTRFSRGTGRSAQ
ncbi:hypothetical protein [Arsenicibacter rosenii]|uniref:hypothetical protein n=1 Tax=Arsenicibacter rosenii TaxID=1750698 RepID=UPI0015A6AF7B|nr:hypothetical protein [Arsenicibacter rosenii]